LVFTRPFKFSTGSFFALPSGRSNQREQGGQQGDAKQEKKKPSLRFLKGSREQEAGSRDEIGRGKKRVALGTAI
jgi:hypothetical protein